MTIVITVLIFMSLVSWIPGAIASSRRHRQTMPIAVCGVLGVIFFPCWLAALVWSLTSDVDSVPPTTRKTRRRAQRNSRVRRRTARHQAQDWTAEDAGQALEALSEQHE